MHLQAGTLLQGGKYKIEKVLGQGGFGITYLATQEFFDRHVCIKEFFFKDYCERGSQGEVTSCTTSNKDLVDRFLNKFIKEARTISRLEHPNIVRILDIFQENGTAYYAMEYIDGCSLADKVNAQGALSEAVAVDYIKQVADALDCIHQRSINHLDVKPANIMVRQSDNKAILIDFGLSKQYDEQGGQTSTTPVGISHGYAPMEQYNQGGVSTFSPQTDIYALGATLYKLVTGSTPPQAIEVFNEGLTGLPQSLSPNLEFAIKKTMQPRRNDRPQSISEFCALLGGQFSSNVSSSTTQNSDDESTRVIGEDTSNELAKKEKASQSIVTKVKAKEESSSKKWLWLLVVFVVAVLAIVLWPKGNSDLEVYEVPTEISALPVEVNDSAVVDVAFSMDTVAIVDVEKVQPTTTSLYVTTTPSGVSVYVDGQKIGTTPIEGKDISCGSHKMKLSKEGYQVKAFTRVFGDKPIIINETLVEAPKAQTTSQTLVSKPQATPQAKEQTLQETEHEQIDNTFSVNTSGNKITYMVNGVSFTMICVDGGTFTMGANKKNVYDDDRPSHQVILNNYSIGETEVTQALWQAVMGRNPSFYQGNLQRPVERVDWNDCQEFIRKLNLLTGATFRLPTEAEWEYAARGGSHSRNYKYCGSNSLGPVAWHMSNSSLSTHPVKEKKPNELGLYDMSGNVMEWCSDWYDSNYYSNTPSFNPKGPSTGFMRVVRGGSCMGSAEHFFRVSGRLSKKPSEKHESHGLRLAQ